MNKVKILIADDHQIFIDSLKSLLHEEKDLRVIGGALNGEEVLTLTKRETPDIILLDIEMPVMNGDETLQALTNDFPDVKTIILSGFLEEDRVSYYMSRGACAALPKECSHEHLLNAIYAVVEKGFYLNESVLKALWNSITRDKSGANDHNRFDLSRREVQVLKLLCAGRKNKEIAEELFIAFSTVDFHRRKLYSKTGTVNLASLVVFAVKNGLI
jgi:DNA-binding NarL/FixJ family response regulator